VKVSLQAAALFCLLAAIALGATVTGCTIGTRTTKGGAELSVTRDFGARRLLQTREDPIPSGETVMRFVMREANVKTRYGGRFVDAINGVRSSTPSGRRRDWFYYVNGIEADTGAADRDLAGSDRIWWDYHDWSGAMRIPAVVGSYPEPFLHGTEGKRFPVRVDCAENAQQACRDVADRLDKAGVPPSTTAIGAPAGKDLLRLVVGKWSDVRSDGAAALLDDGPAHSGVFARFGRGAQAGSYVLDLTDEHGKTVRTLATGAGLVAATRFEEQQPTWVVTGTDSAGLDRAVALLERGALADRFAVATDGGQPIALPIIGGAGP
jgi:hypothetical protein